MRSRRIKYFVGSVAIVLVVTVLFFTVRWYREFKTNIRGRMCVQRVGDLADKMHIYAAEHEGQLPDKISDLYPDYVSNLEDLVCPEVKHKAHGKRAFSSNPTAEEIDSLSSYAVVSGVTTCDPAETTIIHEKNDNHPNVKRVRANMATECEWDSPEHRQ